MAANKPFHEIVAEKLIEQLKAGTAPWQRPWEFGEPNLYLPMNPVSGKRYRGINAVHLLAQGRADSRWMTYKQAAELGAQVRKGEKGTAIQYWKLSTEKDKLDEKGQQVLDAHGKPIRESVKLDRSRVFFSTVFCAEQIDGLPALQRKEPTWNPIERAELILRASGAAIFHGQGFRAFYRPSTDTIHLPDKGLFPTPARYYATALHELGHWTGHESRLKRDLSNPFGTEGYAKEELRAEIASMIVGSDLGIGHDPDQHASYVASWIKVLEEDALELFRAAADAEKAYDFVLALEQKYLLEQEAASKADLDELYGRIPLVVSEPISVASNDPEDSRHTVIDDNDEPGNDDPGTKKLFIEAYACDDHGDGPEWIEVDDAGALFNEIARLRQLTQDHSLNEIRVSRGPDMWGPDGVEDDLRLQNDELVVTVNEFWFVSYPKQNEYRVNTRPQSIDDLAAALKGEYGTEIYMGYDADALRSRVSEAREDEPAPLRM